MAHLVKDATIRVRTLDNGWETIGVDRARGISHENLEYDHDRWGSLTASFDLRRAPRVPWPDIAAFTDVEIEIAGVQTWKGRVKGTPTRDGQDRSMNVQCEGLQAHLDDDTYVPFYVHTRLSDFKDSRSYPTTDLVFYRQAGNVATDTGVSMGFPVGANVANTVRCGVTFDAGPAATIKQVVYEVSYGNAHSGSMALRISGTDAPSPTDASEEVLVNTSIAGGTGTTDAAITGATFTTAHRYVHVFITNNSGVSGTISGEMWAKLRSVLLVTSVDYQAGNVSILKASTVIADALSRATVLLDADRSLIAATSFNLPDLAVLDDKTPREVWDAVNAFHNYASKIDERGRPVFQPLPSAPLLEVGEWAALDGSDASQNSGADIYNRAVAYGQSPAGAPVRFERYQAELAGAALSVVSAITNPSFDTNTTGWTKTSISGSSSLARSTATFQSSPASGELTVSGAGAGAAIHTDLSGTFEAGRTYLLRAWVRISDVAARASMAIGQRSGAAGTWGLTSNSASRTATPSGAGSWQQFVLTWVPSTSTSSVQVALVGQTLGGTVAVSFDTLSVEAVSATRVDRRGFRRTKRLPIDAPIPTDGTAATQILDTFLATHKTAQFKGEYVITGPVREILTGKTVPPEQLGMRTTELLRFTDRIDPDTGAVGRDGRIVRVKYSHAEDQASVSIDNSSQNFEALLARYGALVGGPR